MHANGLTDKIDLAELSERTIAAERMAGTACGGMDQTISIMAEKATAKLVEFIPSIKATNVKVPENVSIVVTNSLTPSPKLLTLGTRYNKRVVECKFALCALTFKYKGVPYNECPFKTFYEL
jgi:galactokinase